MNKKFFQTKYISKSNTVNNTKRMILTKIRGRCICFSGPHAVSVLGLFLDLTKGGPAI